MKKITIFLLVITLFGCAAPLENDNDKSKDYTITAKDFEEIMTGEPNSTTGSPLCTTTKTNTTKPFDDIVETMFTTTISIPNDGQLVRVLDYIPDAEIDLKYATTNNFTNTIIYDDSEAYLCYGTVKKLINVQEELKEKGYRILIWDAYRSVEAQWKLWNTYPNPTYVANPNNGITSHSRGNTVDISIVNNDGSPIEMPSDFDEFSKIADRNYCDVSESAAINSMILEEIMYKNGFTGYQGEWWDYSDIDKYDIEIMATD